MFKYSKSETELNAVHFIQYLEQPYVIVGGASGGVSIFDINNRKQCFQQKEQDYT